MNVLLDIFVDSNFGDDCFLNILLNRYRNANFYIFTKNPDQFEYLKIRNSNLEICKINYFLLENGFFDVYLLMGGDMFPNIDNYDYREYFIDFFFKNKKEILFIGFSLKKNYSLNSLKKITDLCSKASMNIVRDTYSLKLLKSQNIDKVYLGADITFIQNDTYQVQLDSKATLGISVRKAFHWSDSKYRNYCMGMAKIATDFLIKHKSNKIIFLCLSSGEYNDKDVAEDIISLMLPSKQVTLYSYTGDLEAYFRCFSLCEMIITTRFHALIFALKYNKPFIPFCYEDKIDNLLQDISYTGPILTLDNLLEPTTSQSIIDSLSHWETPFDINKYKNMISRAIINFQQLDLLYQKYKYDKNILDFSNTLHFYDPNKKIIIFGTGSLAQKFLEEINIKVDYFLDNDEKKQGNLLNGKSIYKPEKLYNEDFSKIKIIICSQYFNEIAFQLNDMKLIKSLHYVIYLG